MAIPQSNADCPHLPDDNSLNGQNHLQWALNGNTCCMQ